MRSAARLLLSFPLLAALFAVPPDVVAVAGEDADPGVLVSGFVRDVAGAGVAGVPVTWRLTPRGDDKFHPWQDVRTDANGRYEIPGVGRGKLDFGVWAETNLFEGSYLHATTESVGAPILRDFVVEGSFVFAGRVESPADAPASSIAPAIANAPIDVAFFRRSEHGGGCSTGGTAGRRVTLGPDRTFRLTALCPGVYDLWVGGPGMAGVSREVELTGDVTGYVVERHPAAEIAGRVVVPPGASKPYRYVRLETEDGKELAMSDSYGADSSFSFPNVPSGRYRVTVHIGTGRLDDATMRNLNASVPVEMPAPPRRIELAPVTPLEEADVGLAVTLPPDAMGAIPRKAAGERAACRVEGRVWIGAGAAADVQRFTAGVNAKGATGIAPVLGMMPPQSYVRTDGSLRLFGVAAGSRLHLRVEAFAFLPEERDVDIDGATTVLVPLRRAPGRVVVPGFDPWGERIDYFVVEAREVGGKPGAAAPGPWIRVLHGDTRVRITDLPPPEGLVGFLPPGTYEFRMTTDKRPQATIGPVVIEDRPGEPPLEVDFRRPDGRKIAGRLFARKGGHPAERLLRVFRVEDGRAVLMPERETFASSVGYEIPGLLAGRYRIAVGPSGAVPLAEVVVADSDVTLDLALCR